MFVFKHLTTLRTLMESTWHLGFFLFEGVVPLTGLDLVVISTGDDAIAIKSGLNKAGTTFGMPSHQIHLHDLEIHSKCLSLGSEMSGGIHNVLVENVRFGDQRPNNHWHGIFIKSSRCGPRCAPTIVMNGVK
eukprot:symbB.v1.2.028012.t1/scaffold2922.1/size67172/2